MARYTGKKRVSEETRDEGMRIAKSTQRPGQTKEQTKLIAQGIQRGIDLYKKKHKVKTREVDRKLRRVASGGTEAPAEAGPEEGGPEPRGQPVLPWLLLALTWLGIGVYLLSPSLPALLGG